MAIRHTRHSHSRAHRVVCGRDRPALVEKRLNTSPLQLALPTRRAAIPILADKGNNAAQE